MKNKPLIILFDANPLVNGNKSGVGYYTYNLIESLAKTYPDEIKITAHYFNFLGRKNSARLPTHSNITYVQSKLIPGKVLSLTRKLGFQIPLEFFFRKSGDVAIFTNFVSLPSMTNTPTFVAVHDLCYEEVPEYVSDKNQAFLHKFVPKSIKKSDKVITISESTKKAIKKFYKTSDKNIIITPIPPTKPVFKSKEYLEKFKIKNKYILFVSNLEPRKNFINLVKAYEKLPSKTRDSCSLVLVGGKGWKIERQLEYIENLQKRGVDIVLTGYVSDDERASLYTNASLFVMPSHYEGFGMPILEAMSYSLPTVISDIPVFHEVAGANSTYFDKDDPNDMAKKINKLLTDEKLSSDLSKKGLAHVKSYNWVNVSSLLYKEFLEISKNKTT